MARLADIAMVVTGVAPEPEGSADVQFVQIKDLTPDRRALTTGGLPTAKRALPIELRDILMAARGERCKAVRPDQGLVGAFAAPDIYLVRPDLDLVDPDFLAAFLNRNDVSAALRAEAKGGSLPRIPKDALSGLVVPLPPLDRQRTIGKLAVAADHHRHLMLRLLSAETRLFETCLERAFADLR